MAHVSKECYEPIDELYMEDILKMLEKKNNGLACFEKSCLRFEVFEEKDFDLYWEDYNNIANLKWKIDTMNDLIFVHSIYDSYPYRNATYFLKKHKELFEKKFGEKS